MVLNINILIPAIIGITSYILVPQIIKFTTYLGMKDIPNERSSHKVIKLRGGGIAIVFSATLGWSYLFYQNFSYTPFNFSILFAALMIALIGWIDDKKNVSAKLRAFIHFLAALIVVQSFKNNLSLSFSPIGTLNNYFASTFSVFYLVWMTNLFNFMDGIDGIATSQAFVVSILSALFAICNGSFELSLIYFTLAAATAGFLPYNWQPAKIFMGDVCSGFLGFTLGALSLYGEFKQDLPWGVPVILMGTFITDTTVTLIQRILRKQKFYSAHRDHAYQKATKLGYSHQTVTLSNIALTCLWLGPIAFFNLLHPNWTFILLFISYFPLILIAIFLNAGLPEDKSIKSSSTSDISIKL